MFRWGPGQGFYLWECHFPSLGKFSFLVSVVRGLTDDVEVKGKEFCDFAVIVTLLVHPYLFSIIEL